MMKPESVTYTPIGVIRTPFADPWLAPTQPMDANDTPGKVVVAYSYAEALKHVEGFSHLILLYHLHRAGGFQPHVRPFRDDRWRGLFATRHPRRPNPIGLSVVRLVKRHQEVLEVAGVDMVDNSPLLDIKPFVPQYDNVRDIKIGWLEGKLAPS